VLGLDISTNSTGWCILEYLDEDKYKLIDYGLIERKGMDIGETLVYFERQLLSIINQFNPHGISAEAPFVGRNNQTIQKLCMFHGVMQLIAKKEKMPIVYYAVMTLKSKVLGGMKTKNEDGTISISKNRFTMPYENITISAIWDNINPKTSDSDVIQQFKIIILCSMLIVILLKKRTNKHNI
jgi:Holliday junction resolvasome RuvABC endonuclease subunit